MTKKEEILKSKLFNQVDLNHCDFEENEIEEIFFSEGSVIFREGSSANDIHFVSSGEVNILDNQLIDQTKLVSIIPGMFFGYTEILSNSPHSSTAIAIRDSFLFTVPAKGFIKSLQKSATLRENLQHLLENNIDEMLNTLENLVAEEQKELKIETKPVEAVTESSSNPVNKRAERMARMRQTLIEFDDIETNNKEDEEKVKLIVNDDDFSAEDKSSGYGKVVKDDVVIIVVFLERATLEHASGFKNFVQDTIMFGSKKIIVDLSRTEFLDSTFLGVLVSSLKKIVARKGDLRLVFAKQEPLGLLQLTRMDKIFNIYKQLNDAMGSFKE